MISRRCKADWTRLMVILIRAEESTVTYKDDRIIRKCLLIRIHKQFYRQKQRLCRQEKYVKCQSHPPCCPTAIWAEWTWVQSSKVVTPETAWQQKRQLTTTCRRCSHQGVTSYNQNWIYHKYRKKRHPHLD